MKEKFNFFTLFNVKNFKLIFPILINLFIFKIAIFSLITRNNTIIKFVIIQPKNHKSIIFMYEVLDKPPLTWENRVASTRKDVSETDILLSKSLLAKQKLKKEIAKMRQVGMYAELI